MKNQKITIVFLTALLVAGATTIASPILIDDASATSDRHSDGYGHDKQYDSKYSDDSYDKEREYDSKYSSLSIVYNYIIFYILIMENTFLD